VRRRLITASVAAVSIGLAVAMAAVSPALAGPVNVRGITTVTVTDAVTAPVHDTSQAEAACGSGQLLVGATVPANSSQAADVSCGAGQVLLGGGYVMDSIGQDWLIAATAPGAANQWQVQADDLDSNSRDFSSTAMCLLKA
jgi:hypothetical protein